MQVPRHQQQFQRHRDRMFRTSRWMPGKRRENAVQKMLVMKQMMQVVEVHSPIQDRWLTTACPSSGGRPRRSEPMPWHWRGRIRRSWQRAGAFGLSAGVAMDLRLGWDLGQRADQVKAEKRLSDEKPHLLILSPMCLSLSLSLDCNTPSQTSWRNCGSRANVIWSLHAVQQDCKSSKVDAFSSSIPWRRHKSRACGS